MVGAWKYACAVLVQVLVLELGSQFHPQSAQIHCLTLAPGSSFPICKLEGWVDSLGNLALTHLRPPGRVLPLWHIHMSSVLGWLFSVNSCSTLATKKLDNSSVNLGSFIIDPHNNSASHLELTKHFHIHLALPFWCTWRGKGEWVEHCLCLFCCLVLGRKSGWESLSDLPKVTSRGRCGFWNFKSELDPLFAVWPWASLLLVNDCNKISLFWRFSELILVWRLSEYYYYQQQTAALS